MAPRPGPGNGFDGSGEGPEDDIGHGQDAPGAFGPDADADAAERQMRFVFQLRSRGVTDPRVLAAMERIDRGAFVRGHFEDRAYEDTPLPIACGQTISQPTVVGLMTQALNPGPRDTVLEVGTGSGYQAAVLMALGVTTGDADQLGRHGCRLYRLEVDALRHQLQGAETQHSEQQRGEFVKLGGPLDGIRQAASLHELFHRKLAAVIVVPPRLVHPRNADVDQVSDSAALAGTQQVLGHLQVVDGSERIGGRVDDCVYTAQRLVYSLSGEQVASRRAALRRTAEGQGFFPLFPQFCENSTS